MDNYWAADVFVILWAINVAEKILLSLVLNSKLEIVNLRWGESGTCSFVNNDDDFIDVGIAVQ